MSLFANLLNLHSGSRPLEDFFTEIVAYFFQTNKHLLITWLQEKSIIHDGNYHSINIYTQKEYEGLEGHTKDSRFDILIELSNHVNTDVILIESKIGSTDGHNNLKRYAEILSALTHVRQRVLIYITRDYDSKDDIKTYCSNLCPKVAFSQLRWSEFYAFLQKKSDYALVPEILVFMRKNGMAHKHQFSPVDLITMMNFNKTLGSMQATISDEVEKEFKEAFGHVKRGSASMTQWRGEGRYIIYTYLSADWNFWCGLGYFDLNPKVLSDYPNIGICLEVSPSCKYRSEIINSMQEVVSHHPDKWFSHNLTVTPNWSSIFYRRNLQDFVADQDHFSAIKAFFLESIKELKTVQEKYFDLSWKSLKEEAATEVEKSCHHSVETE